MVANNIPGEFRRRLAESRMRPTELAAREGLDGRAVV